MLLGPESEPPAAAPSGCQRGLLIAARSLGPRFFLGEKQKPRSVQGGIPAYWSLSHFWSILGLLI